MLATKLLRAFLVGRITCRARPAVSTVRSSDWKTKRRRKKIEIGVNVSRRRSNRCADFQLKRSKVMRTAAQYVGTGGRSFPVSYGIYVGCFAYGCDAVTTCNDMFRLPHKPRQQQQQQQQQKTRFVQPHRSLMDVIAFGQTSPAHYIHPTGSNSSKAYESYSLITKQWRQ